MFSTKFILTLFDNCLVSKYFCHRKSTEKVVHMYLTIEKQFIDD